MMMMYEVSLRRCMISKCLTQSCIAIMNYLKHEANNPHLFKRKTDTRQTSERSKGTAPMIICSSNLFSSEQRH